MHLCGCLSNSAFFRLFRLLCFSFISYSLIATVTVITRPQTENGIPKMTNSILDSLSLPAPGEIEAAVRGQRELAAYLSTKMETQKISIQDADNNTRQVELPTSALTLLMSILGELAVGNAVQVVPVHAELTTQEAANILNVSRPHMVKLLEDGKLPFHKTGRHRRVLFADLMDYKHQRDNESSRAMQALADHSQELGLY